MEKKNFAQLIREKRKSKDLSYAKLEEVANGLGYKLSASYIYRLETGKRKEPTVSTLKALVDSLNLSLGEVLNSLNMDDVFYDDVAVKPTIRIPKDLEKLKLVIPLYDREVTLSASQTRILGKMFNNFYQLAARGLTSDNESLASIYLQELNDTIEPNDVYLISIQDQNITMEFDSEVLMKKHQYSKEEICKELEQLNLKAIYSSGPDITLDMFDSLWSAKRDHLKLTIIENISEKSKSFRKIDS